jgi:hypothetical protein
MKNDNINEKIYDLINRKNYNDLSFDDKQFLLSQNISEDKYNSLIKAEIEIKDYFDNENQEVTDSLMLQNLLKEIPAKSKVNFIFRKLPAYYTIAASLVVFLMSWTLFTNIQSNQISFKEKLIYDTIYISNQVEPNNNAVNVNQNESKPKISKQNKTNSNYQKRSKSDSSSDSRMELPSNEFVGLGNMKLVNSQSKGISQSDDSIISKFRFTMQRDISNVSELRKF